MIDALGRELKVGDPAIIWEEGHKTFTLVMVTNTQPFHLIYGSSESVIVQEWKYKNSIFSIEPKQIWRISAEELALWVLQK